MALSTLNTRRDELVVSHPKAPCSISTDSELTDTTTGMDKPLYLFNQSKAKNKKNEGK